MAEQVLSNVAPQRVWACRRSQPAPSRCHHVARDERPIEPSRDNARQRRFAFGAAEERSGQFDLKRFMRLARGMGIPADDAARLAMNIVIEQRRENDPSQVLLHQHQRLAEAFPHVMTETAADIDAERRHTLLDETSTSEQSKAHRSR